MNSPGGSSITHPLHATSYSTIQNKPAIERATEYTKAYDAKDMDEISVFVSDTLWNTPLTKMLYSQGLELDDDGKSYNYKPLDAYQDARAREYDRGERRKTLQGTELVFKTFDQGEVVGVLVAGKGREEHDDEGEGVEVPINRPLRRWLWAQMQDIRGCHEAHCDKFWLITDLAVKPSHRQHGVECCLLDKATEYADTHGAALLAVVHDEAGDPYEKQLYEKYGFVETPHILLRGRMCVGYVEPWKETDLLEAATNAALKYEWFWVMWRLPKAAMLSSS
ncbi:hypothetical protein F4810DRAFT_566630 [Camillea tinctor]|nr:hypothetical protein F4810DRAFT_566630 [Camillea tinctor]